MRLLVMLLLCSAALGAQRGPVAGVLRVIVIDGDEAANIVAEKLAAEPVIEVRDEENRRVVGAVVRFTIRRTLRDRVAALFRNGEAEVRTLTDAAGRARATAVTPLEAGSFEIDVQVSHQGQTASARLRHTNYATVAEARAAGREPGQSSGSSAVPPAAVSAGGGVSKLAIIGLAVGGAAGAGAAVVLSRRDNAAGGEAARVTGVTTSQASGIQAATPFGFAAQVADFDAGSLTYRWEFGDGAASTEATPTHIYNSPGTYTVVVTVADTQQSARAETLVTVHTIAGTWVSSGSPVTTLQLSQAATTINGTGAVGVNEWTQCVVTGSVQGGASTVIELNQAACPHPFRPDWAETNFLLRMAVDGQTLVGDAVQPPFTTRIPLTFRRQ